MVGVSCCSPDLDNQPHPVRTSISHPTLTEVSKITSACISWLRKHRHVDRGCAIEVHGGSWDHLGNDDLSRSKMLG
jgi:hypothetical protein